MSLARLVRRGLRACLKQRKEGGLLILWPLKCVRFGNLHYLGFEDALRCIAWRMNWMGGAVDPWR